MQQELKKPEIKEISINQENEVKEERPLAERHVFKLKNFDGPLDLLVHLIKEKNIDIFDVDLAELATQYLEIIKGLEAYEFDIASEYLVMAATLLQLKARIILQDPEVEEEIKEEKKRLLEQIAEYEKFKEISLVLKKQEEIRGNYFTKNPDDISEFAKEIDSTVLDGHANSSRLVIALRKMFERTYAELIRNVTISTIAVSPEEQKKRILKLFKNRNEVDFKEIFDVPTVGHFVITLLAILDLARQEIVVMEQLENEGLIKFYKGVEYEE
ncbi:segregation and condensation protein A [Metamycoplasma cloacale]|uniref:Segregation and condensation protein A n=1 Tax=Metamycoplasma cloacale TaxID=92401 RepID=A0A2Z4LLJ8_9BACT|nr:segregation/condensation protein A [Metamycoplasma cloacale]AWX42641.1 segregation/condensation protein A [Metamycoplasma cloacale]VEU79578.1 segregation and condensation protein A [Metamycoplasma cloacale]